VSVTLCVSLWPREGHDDELIAYEDAVLALVADHGGTVVQRARTNGDEGAPLEVQLITFPSEAAFDAYMADDRRVAWSDERDHAIGRTEVWRVSLV
jgi:hypothetical protein